MRHRMDYPFRWCFAHKRKHSGCGCSDSPGKLNGLFHYHSSDEFGTWKEKLKNCRLIETSDAGHSEVD